MEDLPVGTRIQGHTLSWVAFRKGVIMPKCKKYCKKDQYTVRFDDYLDQYENEEDCHYVPKFAVDLLEPLQNLEGEFNFEI